jgi:Ser/Thr protein kinase RdoA (MazF antagonist)
VPRHGDFWPGNVFVAPGRCEAIDFEGVRDGLAGEDVAYFLLHLEAFLPSPLLRARRRSAARAFLAGYGATPPFDRRLLRLCRLAAAVRIYHHLPAEAGARRRRFLAAALSV